MFKRLVKLMGQPDMADDPRFADNNLRVTHQEEIDGKIAQWALSGDSPTLLSQLDDAGVAAGPIYSVEDIFNDPQYQARELLQQVTVDGEPLTIPAIIPRLSETPGGTDWPGPAVGSHNDEIFREILNLSDEKQEELRTQGVI